MKEFSPIDSREIFVAWWYDSLSRSVESARRCCLSFSASICYSAAHTNIRSIVQAAQLMRARISFKNEVLFSYSPESP
jgi:hypothetical protein